MSEYSLRLLEPTEDAELFRLAYEWRTRPKSHVQPDRMPFEEFAAEKDDQIAIGLFNGELRAVYFLHETEPTKYQCHFTSERGTRVPTLVAAARQVAADFFAAGATELHAWVTKRNTALRSFLSQSGFTYDSECEFLLRNDTDGSILPDGGATSARCFVKYVLRG